MAAIDLSLLKVFDMIFPFLLVWTISYATLGQTKTFGEKKQLNAMIAMILAFMTLFSPVVLKAITIMAPWFAFLMLFIGFGLLAMMSLGPTSSDVKKFVSEGGGGFVFYWILALVLIVVLGSLFKAVSDFGGVPGFNDQGGQGTGQEQQFWKTLFHPKVLGMIFVMLVAMFTVMKLAESK